MEKAVAVLAAFLFCTFIGFRVSARYTRRLRTLMAVESGVKRMLSALCYSRLPLFEIAARPVYGEAQCLFDAFCDQLSAGATAAEAWNGAVDACAGNDAGFAALSGEDRALLCSFSSALGATDCKAQRENGELLLSGLSGAAADASAQAAGKSRVVRAMGVLTGAAVAILLL